MPEKNSPKQGSGQELPSSLREILNSTDGDGQDAKRFAEASREAQEEQEMSPGMRAMMSAFESLAEESKE